MWCTRKVEGRVDSENGWRHKPYIQVQAQQARFWACHKAMFLRFLFLGIACSTLHAYVSSTLFLVQAGHCGAGGAAVQEAGEEGGACRLGCVQPQDAVQRLSQESGEGKVEKGGGGRRRKAPAGWDVFNSKTLYNAYLKRVEKVWVRLEEAVVEKKGGACRVGCVQPSNPVQCLFE